MDKAIKALEDAIDQEANALQNHVLRGLSLDDATVAAFSLDKAMSQNVIADVKSSAENMTRKQLLPYDPSYQTNSSQVLVEPLEEIPELATIDALVRNNDVPYDDGNGSSVMAMAHSVGTGDNQIVAYRLKGSGIATKRQRGIPIVPRDGVYQRVQHEILYYEPHFDVLTTGGLAFFTTVSLIQNKLQAPHKSQRLAKQTLRSVTSNIVIDGYSKLEEAVAEDPTLRAKMAYVARIIQEAPEYADHLTTERLVNFVEDNPVYEILTTQKQGEKCLIFDTSPQHRHKIPRLLADDYLHSLLTERDYEAGSKQGLSS